MSTNTTRRLLAEDRQRVTMKTRVAQWRSRNVPCICHNCRLHAAIRAMVAAGQVVHVAGDVVAQSTTVAVDPGVKH